MNERNSITRRDLLRGRLAGGRAADGQKEAGQQGENAADDASDLPVPSGRPRVVKPLDAPTPDAPSKAEPAGLPPLHEVLLDAAMGEQLFRDIEKCDQVLEVLPKFGPGYVGKQRVPLQEAAQLIKDKQVRAVQVRYVYEKSQWWDTLIPGPDGTLVVRIRHDDDGDGEE
jgi:hypothetical protein